MSQSQESVAALQAEFAEDLQAARQRERTEHPRLLESHFFHSVVPSSCSITAKPGSSQKLLVDLWSRVRPQLAIVDMPHASAQMISAIDQGLFCLSWLTLQSSHLQMDCAETLRGVTDAASRNTTSRNGTRLRQAQPILRYIGTNVNSARTVQVQHQK